jgi:hypothetical protein
MCIAMQIPHLAGHHLPLEHGNPGIIQSCCLSLGISLAGGRGRRSSRFGGLFHRQGCLESRFMLFIAVVLDSLPLI